MANRVYRHKSGPGAYEQLECALYQILDRARGSLWAFEYDKDAGTVELIFEAEQPKPAEPTE